MTTHIDKVRDGLEDSQYAIDRDDYPRTYCKIGEALDALQAHEAEVKEREAVLAELVGTLVGIRACAKIDGRPEWLTVAEQIDATLSKVKP